MREKCPECGDRIFKIVDESIMCRQGHVVGKLLKMKKVDGGK